MYCDPPLIIGECRRLKYVGVLMGELTPLLRQLPNECPLFPLRGASILSVEPSSARKYEKPCDAKTDKKEGGRFGDCSHKRDVVKQSVC